MDGFAHMGMPGGMGMAGGMFLPGGMQGMMQLPPGMMEPDFGPFSQVLTVAAFVLDMAKCKSQLRHTWPFTAPILLEAADISAY